MIRVVLAIGIFLSVLSVPYAQGTKTSQYSILIEHDKVSVMFLIRSQDGDSRTEMVNYSGFKWFKKVFGGVEKPKMFLTPTYRTISSDYLTFFQSRHEIGGFEHTFVDDESIQRLSITSNELGVNINKYIADEQRFVISGSLDKSWYAGTFKPIVSPLGLIQLSIDSPEVFCKIIRDPLTKNNYNRELKTNNLEELMRSMNIECDPFDNVIVKRTKEGPTGNQESELQREYFQNYGSSFTVSDSGHVVTNYHVIDDCREINIVSGETTHVGQLIDQDKENDIALIKTDKTDSPILPLSNNPPQLLEDVYVAGYPFGDKNGKSVKVTKGIVSATAGMGDNPSEFQFDAAIQPGNSGGPVINQKGEVIGVTSASFSVDYMFEEFGTLTEETNFGVKIGLLKSMLEKNGVTWEYPTSSHVSTKSLGEIITQSVHLLVCVR